MKSSVILILFAFFGLLCVFDGYGQDDTTIRRQYLTDLQDIIIEQRFQKNTRRVTLKDSTWVEWLERSGELPPNFSKMKSTPFLPDPLVYEDDNTFYPIRTQAQWAEKKEWIKEQYQYWVSGNFPEKPDNLTSELLLDSLSEGVRIQKIRLSFGPGQRGRLHLELWLPEGQQNLPVFMTQFTHHEWGQLALRRGYAVCLYAANDGRDDTQAFQALYPDYDFSMLMRRAWGASRVVDYLYERPEINKEQIAITGHSRNGKQSLWAAAFDERIAAVVSSSSSTGGDAPWRFGDPQYASETLDLVTAANAHWFHPRLRFFFGHEDKLPVDQHSLAALIAPRPLLYHYSVTERGLNAWANEQNFYAVRKVYDYFGAAHKVGVHTRRGQHAVAAGDIEFTIDFLDLHFGRSKRPWQNRLYYDYDFKNWLSHNPNLHDEAQRLSAIELKDKYQNIQEFQVDRIRMIDNVRWLLGAEPIKVKTENIDIADPKRYDWIESIIGRPRPKNGVARYYGPYSSFGDHLPVRIYFPRNKQGEIDDKDYPVIIYLHEYAHSTGYSKGYHPRHGNPSNHLLFEKILAEGYAIVAFDQFGFGTRMEEAVNFYERYPGWSKMGKMVSDVRNVLDGLEHIANIDNSRIFLLGNTLGGTVGVYAAALDERIRALVSVGGFSPYRTSNTQYESIRTMSHLHGLIPRLGLFAERPAEVPVDFKEMLSIIAPRPVMVVAPTLDRYTDRPALESTLTVSKEAYALYGKKDALQLYQPRGLNVLSLDMMDDVLLFFNQNQE